MPGLCCRSCPVVSATHSFSSLRFRLLLIRENPKAFETDKERPCVANVVQLHAPCLNGVDL